MSIKHYFFGTDKQRAKFIFDFIAPVYGIIGGAAKKGYDRICIKLNRKVALKDYTILDVGTGTGEWLASISHYSDKKAVGTDFSKKMIEQAQIKYPNNEYIVNDAEALNKFDDNSFDIVTASFVLHGMRENDRAVVLKEMKRIARKYVMIHDFEDDTPFVVKILEFLERSDYINFKKYFKEELEKHFDNTDIVKCSRTANAVYIGLV
ncbi:MAG: class I SAM-dependent methyltransferase [Bacteroidales bacterium]|nr:class I SAM-dependent methyltransferase [Bacteroidales bacterium]